MLVSTDELTQYMGNITLTIKQKGIVETVILPGVQQQLEVYLNRPVEPVQVREGLQPDEAGYLWFSVTPVHKVLSVKRTDGQNVVVTSYTPVELTGPGSERVWDAVGIGMTDQPFRYQVPTPYAFEVMYPILSNRPYYVAEYVAGYNGFVDEALKVAITRVAAREVEMQFDDTQSLRGGTTEAAAPSDSRTKGWTTEELRQFDRLRRRVVV